MTSFILSLSVWDWLEAVGILMVFIGVLCGFCTSRSKFKSRADPNDLMPAPVRISEWESKKKSRESIWEGVLIIGLALEVFAFPRHVREAQRLNQSAAETGERAALVESNNVALSLQVERLRSNNLVLRAKASELEDKIAQTSNSVVNVDPLNQPVSDISAEATVILKGTNFEEQPAQDFLGVAWMGLHESETNMHVSMLGEFANLGAEKYDRFSDNGHAGYFMHFHTTDFERAFFNGIGLTRLRAAQVIDLAKVVTISAMFLPNDAEVLSGNVQILINGIIRKRFIILPQKSFVFHEPWQETNTTDSCLTIIATNSTPINVAPLPK